MCMYVLECMHKHPRHEGAHGDRGGFQTSGTGVTGSWESPSVSAGSLTPDPLQEQQMLLTPPWVISPASHFQFSKMYFASSCSSVTSVRSLHLSISPQVIFFLQQHKICPLLGHLSFFVTLALKFGRCLCVLLALQCLSRFSSRIFVSSNFENIIWPVSYPNTNKASCFYCIRKYPVQLNPCLHSAYLLW